MGNYSTKDLTKDLLICASIGMIIPVLLIAPGLPLALKPFINKPYHPAQIKNNLRRLERQKFISISEQDGKTKIELLEKGKKRILLYDIEKLKLNKKKWDGLWRFVVFDIPETKRSARDFLRSKMREIGFYQLQKSVLITPWECKEIIDFIKLYYEVGECVNLILAKNFDEEDKVKKYFKLI